MGERAGTAAVALVCTVVALIACRGSAASDDWGVAGLNRPRHVTVDDQNVYFVDEVPESADEIGIFRAPLAGGLARAVALEEKNIAGLVSIGHEVCWNAFDRGEIRCAPKAGGTLPRVVASEEKLHDGLATDGRELFFARREGPLLAVAPAGGAVRTVSPTSARVLGAAGGKIWLASNTALLAVPTTGGSAESIAAIESATSIAVSGRWLYVMAWGGGNGTLLRAPLDGGAPQALAKLFRPWCLAADDDHVWVCTNASDSTEGDQSRLGIVDKDGKVRLEKTGQYYSTGAFHRGWFYWVGPQKNLTVLRRTRP